MSKKQELKNYVVNSIVRNALEPNELLRLINLLPDQPQLNENQQIVLSWLKIKHFDSYFKAAVSDLFFYVRHDDIEGFPNLNYRKLVEGYKQLSDKEFAQVLEVFSRWAQEREEG